MSVKSSSCTDRLSLHREAYNGCCFHLAGSLEHFSFYVLYRRIFHLVEVSALLRCLLWLHIPFNFNFVATSFRIQEFKSGETSMHAPSKMIDC